MDWLTDWCSGLYLLFVVCCVVLLVVLVWVVFCWCLALVRCGVGCCVLVFGLRWLVYKFGWWLILACFECVTLMLCSVVCVLWCGCLLLFVGVCFG